jgi:hypothetical protein
VAAQRSGSDDSGGSAAEAVAAQRWTPLSSHYLPLKLGEIDMNILF